MSEYDYKVKILLVGDSGVGKTCLLLRYNDNYFQDNFVSTIGVDFRSKLIEYNHHKVNIQVWDTAGQDKFRSITSTYYRGAEGVMIAFDVTNANSIKRIKYWQEEVYNNIERNISIPIILVGNKIDLLEKREVSYEEGERIANELNMDYFECSSKTNEGVEEAFDYMISKIKPSNFSLASRLKIEEDEQKNGRKGFLGKCC